MDEKETIHPLLLCLKCRQSGHIVDECRSNTWYLEFEWFFSERRRDNDIIKAPTIPNEILCKRCRDLDVISLLQKEIQWTSSSMLDRAYWKGALQLPSLGTVGSIRFWKNCQLCRCLFAMTPDPRSSKQNVHILTQWTMNRLTGECSIEMDTEEKKQSTKCLLVILNPSIYSLAFSERAHRGDALCLATDNNPSGTTGLGGREIDLYQLNTKIIDTWISVCSERHRKSCRPVWTEELSGIRLIDVGKRTIVKYPGNDCIYVALSYVWGGVEQESFQLGSELTTVILPQTIEDAITLTKKLGKNYLWVDSICIDQANNADKGDQIGRMWSIYRGAYITIIALSGKSAHSGLPRVGPHVPNQPQLRCSIDGRHLVGLMPTLTQQIWEAPWGKRAWTLQEALLSPRCLYVSDHQMYYECNEMQCCESLDDADSWAHKLGHDSGPAITGWLQSQTGSGCLKNPLDDPADRIGHYGAKITLYSYRSMTYKADSLNAFRGILQQLTTLYGKGFHCGLPIEDFQWGLLWRSHAPPTRRLGFPTWSWAGWEAGMWPAYPSNHYQPHQFPVPLRIWRVVSNQLVQIFHSRHAGPTNGSPARFKNDPFDHISELSIEHPGFNVLQYGEAEKLDYIFIEAITLYFTPDYSHPLTTTRRAKQDALFQFSIKGILCELCIMSVDEQLRDLPKRKKQSFLLLARDRGPRGIIHYLMLLDYKNEELEKEKGEREIVAVAERKTVLEVIVPEERLDVLEELGMRMGRVVLS